MFLVNTYDTDINMNGFNYNFFVCCFTLNFNNLYGLYYISCIIEQIVQLWFIDNHIILNISTNNINGSLKLRVLNKYKISSRLISQ